MPPPLHPHAAVKPPSRSPSPASSREPFPWCLSLLVEADEPSDDDTPAAIALDLHHRLTSHDDGVFVARLAQGEAQAFLWRVRNPAQALALCRSVIDADGRVGITAFIERAH